MVHDSHGPDQAATIIQVSRRENTRTKTIAHITPYFTPTPTSCATGRVQLVLRQPRSTAILTSHNHVVTSWSKSSWPHRADDRNSQHTHLSRHKRARSACKHRIPLRGRLLAHAHRPPTLWYRRILRDRARAIYNIQLPGHQGRNIHMARLQARAGR